MKLRIVMLFSIFLLVSPAFGGPLGMILRVRGEVELTRGSATVAALPGEILQEGDRIHVVSGEALINYCPENGRFRVGQGAEVELQATRLDLQSGDDVRKTGTNTCSFPEVRLGEESLERVGALRPRGSAPGTTVVLFLGGPVSTGRPRFEWKPVTSSDHYVVRLLDEMGDAIWEKSTPEYHLEYPTDEPALEGGWYNWEVVAFEGRETIARQQADFEVHPGENLPSPWSVETDLLLPTAFSYEGDGYFAEAAACLRRYLRTEGEDARLNRHLAWLYRQARLPDASSDQMESGTE
jgi:hypothetical protein